jgi:hypothetical protein
MLSIALGLFFATCPNVRDADNTSIKLTHASLLFMFSSWLLETLREIMR